MTGSLSEGFALQLISPVITATVGTLIIGSLAAWITRRAQDRRVNNQLRHQLVTQMTEAASTFHFEAQRYRRASRAIGNEGMELEDIRKWLADQYVKTRVTGEILESRLAGYFTSDRPRLLWHRTMDLCAIRYFALLGLDIDNLREKNAGPEHTNLTVEELMNEQLVLENYRRSLRDSIRAVLEEPFFSAR